MTVPGTRGIRTLVALVALVAAGAATTAPAPAAERKPAPDVTVLFDKALKKVRKQPAFAKAVMLEADGSTRGGAEVTSAAGITRWRFVLANSGNPDFMSVTIKFRRSSGFAKPKGHPSPFLEDVVIRKAPKMTLDEAVALLGDAGFGDSFTAVTLRNPLGPDRTKPFYIFTLPNGEFVAVNTKTGDVQEFS